MTHHKISIKDRNYSVWEPVGAPNPLLHKLFDGDAFTDDSHILYESPTRTESFPAVLVLNGNKTFGRTTTSKSGKPGRLLYQCIPNNPNLPVFLVPYEVKLDFSKVVKNKYVIIHFDHWQNTHPQGILDSVLGDVDEYFAFSEYQLHCRNLIQMQNKAFAEFTKAARQYKAKCDDESFIRNQMRHATDLTHIENIISIDPEGCEDIDDAISVADLCTLRDKGQSHHALKMCEGLELADENLIIVSIYIANVPLWLTGLDLWKHIDAESRITTVYLPDRKVPMLPTVLSEDLCSLKQGKLRCAFVMHATFHKIKKELVSVSYENALIRVKTNYAYEDKKLLKSADYKMIAEVAKWIDASVSDSHEVVATYMKLMNNCCAEKLCEIGKGIFRNQESDQWLSASYSDINAGHAALGLAHYAHITSPIRRIVDLLNMKTMVEWMQNSCMGVAAQPTIEKINKISKSAKKAQMDCELYAKVLDADPETIYTGTIVDVDTDEMGKVTHTVYLEELKVYARMAQAPAQAQHTHYKVHLFDDEHSLQRKIRVSGVH